MRALLPLIVAVCLVTSVVPASAADHAVTVTNNSFSPKIVTIQAGDTVTWTNQGMNHNVAADDGSFRCANGCDGDGGNGDPASNAWSVTLQFDDPGDVPYFCEVHGAPGGIGMSGTVVVQGGAPDNGSLSFRDAVVTVGEGAGSAVLQVQRTGGSDGAVGVMVSTAAGSATPGLDFTAVAESVSWADGDTSLKTVLVPIIDDEVVESLEQLTATLSNPTGGATLASPSTATVRINDNDEAPPDVGTIVVVKEATPGGGEDTFTFTGDASGTIGDGEQIVVGDLDPGTYTVTEAATDGWELTAIICDDTDSSGDVGTATATFELAAGETVTCTFRNLADDLEVPPPPDGEWMTIDELPEFRFKARITSQNGSEAPVQQDEACIAETVCVSGAVAGRSEVFLRVVGPKPNGFLWPTLVKFSTSQVEIWVEQVGVGVLRYYLLAGASPGSDTLAGLFDRMGFQPAGESFPLARLEVVDLPRFSPTPRAVEETPEPPDGDWMTSPDFPGFRAKARITTPAGEVVATRQEAECIDETICVSGAVLGRSEIYIRVVGPKPNGFMWPTLVKFSTSQVEVWIEQPSTGELRYYVLEGASPGSSDLSGLFDRMGFLP